MHLTGLDWGWPGLVWTGSDWAGQGMTGVRCLGSEQRLLMFFFFNISWFAVNQDPG